MLARAKGEEGFGLIELLIAMTVLNIGILAIVAAFNSGAFALRRSNMIASASAIADKKMELYRALRNCAIYLKTTGGYTIPTSGPYAAQSMAASQITDSTTLTSWSTMSGPIDTVPFGMTAQKSGQSVCPVAPPTATAGNPDPGSAHQQVTAADGRQYWVDTYVTTAAVTNGEPVKQVTILVRDPDDSTNTRVLMRESSTFDYYTAPNS